MCSLVLLSVHLRKQILLVLKDLLFWQINTFLHQILRLMGQPWDQSAAGLELGYGAAWKCRGRFVTNICWQLRLLPHPLLDWAGQRTMNNWDYSKVNRKKRLVLSSQLGQHQSPQVCLPNWPSLILGSSRVLQFLTWVPRLSQRYFF